MTLAPETVSRLAHLRDILVREPAEPARVLRRADRRARRTERHPPEVATEAQSPPRERTPTPIRRSYYGPLVYVPRAVQAAFEADGGSGDLALLIEHAIRGPACPRWVQVDGFDVQLCRTSSPLRTRRAWRAVQVRRRQP